MWEVRANVHEDSKNPRPTLGRDFMSANMGYTIAELLLAAKIRDIISKEELKNSGINRQSKVTALMEFQDKQEAQAQDGGEGSCEVNEEMVLTPTCKIEDSAEVWRALQERIAAAVVQGLGNAGEQLRGMLSSTEMCFVSHSE